MTNPPESGQGDELGREKLAVESHDHIPDASKMALPKQDREAVARIIRDAISAAMSAEFTPAFNLSTEGRAMVRQKRAEAITEATDAILAVTRKEDDYRRALEALRHLASEEFSGPAGVSIYAAAANELPRRIKFAQETLAALQLPEGG